VLEVKEPVEGLKFRGEVHPIRAKREGRI